VLSYAGCRWLSLGTAAVLRRLQSPNLQRTISSFLEPPSTLGANAESRCCWSPKPTYGRSDSVDRAYRTYCLEKWVLDSNIQHQSLTFS
jgi:hypothetical protein